MRGGPSDPPERRYPCRKRGGSGDPPRKARDPPRKAWNLPRKAGARRDLLLQHFVQVVEDFLERIDV